MLAGSRAMFYVLALVAGAFELGGYVTFDAQTWVLDIHPFNLRDFVTDAGQTGAALLAAVAVLRGWTGIKET